LLKEIAAKQPSIVILPQQRADEAVAVLTAAFMPDPIFCSSIRARTTALESWV
jgi:hypothetical protein